MKAKLTIFRLILLGSASVWAGALHAFTWDPNTRVPVSNPGALDHLAPNRPHTVVDADSAGHALVVWNNGLWEIRSKLYRPGQGWLDGAYLHTTGDPFSDYLGGFDASMAANGNYCIAGQEIRFSDGGGYVVFTKLRVDLVVGGAAVADDFLAAFHGNSALNSPAFSDVRTAVNENGEALLTWGNSLDHQVVARHYRSGAWQSEVVLDGVDIRSLAVAADATGNFVAVWNPDGERNKIYCRRFIGGAWAARELVGQSAAGGEEQRPRVGMHGEGNIVVAWRHQFSAHNGAAVRRFNGSSWLAVEQVDNGANILGPPDLAVQPDGKAVVLFQHEVGAQAEGPLYANRFDGSAWDGPIDIGCGLQGAKLGVDMDGNGNAVVAFKSGTTFYCHAYQEGLGWLGCSAQGRGIQPNLMEITAPETRQKTIALTPHEIVGAWAEPHGSGGAGTLHANIARKDVWIDGYALETPDPIVDLNVRLPYNDICGELNPPAFQQMRFSNDGVTWSAWETAPSSPPYLAIKTGWDLANPAYGGTSFVGLKRVYIEFQNANCVSLVTHDEIRYTGETIGGVDAGLRVYDGGALPIRIACELPGLAGEPASPLRFFKNGTKYGIILTTPGSPSASKILIRTSSGTKAWAKLP